MAESEELPELGLDQVLAALGRDLVRAGEAASRTPGYGLAVLEAEVELSFTITRTTGRKGQGTLRFEVVPEEGPLDVPGELSSDRSSVHVHRVKLKLGIPPVSQTGFIRREVPQSNSSGATGVSTVTARAPEPEFHGGEYTDQLRPVIEHGPHGNAYGQVSDQYQGYSSYESYESYGYQGADEQSEQESGGYPASPQYPTGNDRPPGDQGPTNAY